MKRAFSLGLGVAMAFSCCCAGTAIAVSAEEDRYAAVYGGLIDSYVTDTVYYSRKDVSEMYKNQYELPVYLAREIDNSCAITAGGAIIGNFDRTYEELIPDHTAIQFMGRYTYKGQDAAVDAMHQELYRRMGSTSAGTTVAGYKSGMTSYVQSKGRSIEIASIYSGSSLNKSSYMSALQAGKLLTVFLDGFSLVYDIDGTHDGYDTISNTIVKGAHVVAAYGYRNIKYYDASNKLVQEDNYLYVHTGFSTGTFGLLRLNKNTTVDDGYAINVT